MLVIPAIDLIDGRCVRLSQGDYDRKTEYGGDPAQLAREFESSGAEVLHVVDLDGAKAGEPKNLDSIRSIREAVKMKIEVGGGVRSSDTVRKLLDLGVDRVILGSVLAADREAARSYFQEFGEQIVAGIDAKGGKVAVHGWIDESEFEVLEFAAEMQELGAKRIILTDIATDGMLAGPNLALLKEATTRLSISVIASGGVGNLQHIKALSELDPAVEGVIVGKALYEGKLDLKEAVTHAS